MACGKICYLSACQYRVKGEFVSGFLNIYFQQCKVCQKAKVWSHLNIYWPSSNLTTFFELHKGLGGTHLLLGSSNLSQSLAIPW